MIVGPTGFVGLALPTPWRITRATVTPEVHTTIREGDRHWVASGETRHVVFERSRRFRAELVVRVAPGEIRRPMAPLAEAAENGAITVGGHPGRYQLGRRREGLWPRRLVPTVCVRHYCDRTRRTILLEVSGAVGIAELRLLLDAVGDLECHDAEKTPA